MESLARGSSREEVSNPREPETALFLVLPILTQLLEPRIFLRLPAPRYHLQVRRLKSLSVVKALIA